MNPFPFATWILNKSLEEEHKAVEEKIQTVKEKIEDDAVKELRDRAPDIYKELLKDRPNKPPLDQDRLKHCADVARLSAKLAADYNLNEEDAYRAGAIHDVMRPSPLDDVGVKETRKLLPKWLLATEPNQHAELGAEVAKRFNIPLEWVDAVRYHSCGRRNMTTEEKILLIADNAAIDRDDSQEIIAVRKIMEQHLDATIRLIYQDMLRMLVRGEDDGKSAGFYPWLHDAFIWCRPDGTVMKIDGKPVHPNSIMDHLGMPDRQTKKMFQKHFGVDDPEHAGYRLELDPHNPDVHRTLSHAFGEIDEAQGKRAKGEVLVRWLRDTSEYGQKFRAFLPSLYPVIWKKYRKVFRQAGKDNKACAHWERIADMARLLDAGSDESFSYWRHYICPTWIKEDCDCMWTKDQFNAEYRRFRRSFVSEYNYMTLIKSLPLLKSKNKKKEKKYRIGGDLFERFLRRREWK